MGKYGIRIAWMGKYGICIAFGGGEREMKKPTNPKDALGIRKRPFSVIPWGVVTEVGLALLEGALKYGRFNWRTAGVRASVYFDATMRHLTAWWEGQDIDPISGLHHVDKAIASLTVLRDAMLQDMLTDDRPPKHNEWDVAMERWDGEAGRLIDSLGGEDVK